MKTLRIVSTIAISLLATYSTHSLSGAAAECTPQASPYRNLFGEYLGVSNVELDAKIFTAWNQLFYGDEQTQRLYYPVGNDKAYILAVDSEDVRSEGMSYGMMIAVQLDRKEEFDRLWNWAKTHMYHPDGERAGYFAWQCRRDGTIIDPGSASDGEEWFVTALYFASARWGDGSGIYNYRAEADALLHTMLHKGETPLGDSGTVNMFDPKEKQVRFVPLAHWAKITDPSYHLPAFYELWAEWAADDKAFWAEAASVSRDFFRKAAHPKTGLMPDYSDFEGRPHVYNGFEHFVFDAHRTLGNVALDWAWFGKDDWQKAQSERVLGFLSAYRPRMPYSFTLEGQPRTSDSSTSLTAMAAVAALASSREVGEPFVRDLWEAAIPDGKYRYYNGLLYMLGLMQTGGRFHVYSPQGMKNPVAEPEKVSFGSFRYDGLDPSFDIPAAENQYRNPILPGYRPDPSMIRVGDAYYLVNSSFAHFPGVPIYKSTDLVNWTQIGNVLDRPSQLELDGQGISRGIFAPAISYNDGTFYMVTTNVGKGGNFYVTAKDPAGPWSDPVWLGEVNGIDPSFFFDKETGRAWLINNGPPPENKPLYDGHRAIWIQEFDAKAGKLIGPRQIIINGGVKLEDKPIWIEGPHIFRKGDWYYLCCAEGGTSDMHSQVIFRSKDPLGPWIAWKDNPILTQRDMHKGRFLPVTSTGHAQLVDAGEAGWWAVFLACRPYEGSFYNTGRETFLLPVAWTEEGWPRILDHGLEVPYVHDVPALPRDESPSALPVGNFAYVDNFSAFRPGYEWLMLRTPRHSWYDTEDGLSMRALPIALSAAQQPAFLGYRIQHSHFSASLEVTCPAQPETDAGMALFQGEKYNFFTGLRRNGNGYEVFVEEHSGSPRRLIARQSICATEGEQLELRVQAAGRAHTFSFRQAGGEWQTLCVADGSILSTSKAGGFVGTLIGPHARQN